MTIVISILAFLLLLSLLIFIHEMGHFLAARKAGVVVEEFGIGIPPRAVKLFKQGGTVFSLNWIPFGGFVRLKGENALDPKERMAPGSFARASVLWRVIVLVAGVFMNFALAIVLFTAGFSFGGWVPLSMSEAEFQTALERGEIVAERHVFIEGVLDESGASKAGVPDDAILTHIDGEMVTTHDSVLALQAEKSSVVYHVLTGEQYSDTKEYEIVLEDGKAGVATSERYKVLQGPKRSVGESAVLAFEESWFLTVSTVKGMGYLIATIMRTASVPEGISGPVGIFSLTQDSVKEGIWHYLRLMAFISLSLAALNILPFPPLDGGRLLFVLAEVVTRRPLNRKIELITNEIGFVLLLALIALVTFNDIVNLIP